MEKKQTAVEWLVEQLIPNAMRMFDATTCNAIEQAKQMEKDQIVYAYREGRSDQQSSPHGPFYHRNAELYFNETFKK